MKKICALLVLITVTLSGCYVDPYRDHGRDESRYGRDSDQREHGDHDRSRENREDHRDGEYGNHDGDH